MAKDFEREKEKAKRKVLKPFSKKYGSPKVGRPSLEEKELTPEQKDFAVMVARGMPPEMAGETLKWTQYQVRRYSELPAVKREVEKWNGIFGTEDSLKYVTMYNEALTSMFLDLKKRADEGKLSESTLNKYIMGKLNQILGLPEETTETSKVTETMQEKKIRSIAPSKWKSAFDMPEFQASLEEESKRTRQIEHKTERRNPDSDDENPDIGGEDPEEETPE